MAWPSFFKRKPANYAARKAELAANLKRPHGYDALGRMTTDEGTHRHTTPLLPSVHRPGPGDHGQQGPGLPGPGRRGPVHRRSRSAVRPTC